jgi:hypothetical protein
MEVIRLYDLIGIEVIWVAEVPDPARRLRVVCLITHDGRPHEVKTADSVLGYTLVPHGGRGIRAYVFWWRVERASQKFTTSLDKVLAIAIAHELGHMLLPDGKHAKAGLMGASWDASQFRSAAAGLLAFSSDSAGLIRREAEKEGLATVAASSSAR